MQISSSSPGVRRWARFLLDSKDPFQIELIVASGTVSLEIVLDPTTIADPIWYLDSVTEGTHFINVTSGDPNFHLGTNYYLSVFQMGIGSSSTAVKYSQEKTYQVLPNGITQKFMFMSKS